MNYTELTNAAIAYADRQDVEVANNMDVYMVLVEARVNRLLKTRKQSARAYTSTKDDTEYYSLPPDYRGMRDVQLNNDTPNVDHDVLYLSYLNPEQMNMISGKPYGGSAYYTVIADQIQIYPKTSAGSTIEMVYYQQVPNLNATDSTNWLSIDHPDIYLAGLTAEIELFAKHYEAADGWYTKLEKLVDELDTADIRERWAGSNLVTRIAND